MKNKIEISKQQYKFCCELIWGGTLVDRNDAEESALFKDRAPKLLEHYPMLDKSFFEEAKRLSDFRQEIFHQLEEMKIPLSESLIQGDKFRKFIESKGINVEEISIKHGVNNKYLNEYLQIHVK